MLSSKNGFNPRKGREDPQKYAHWLTSTVATRMKYSRSDAEGGGGEEGWSGRQSFSFKKFMLNWVIYPSVSFRVCCLSGQTMTRNFST